MRKRAKKSTKGRKVDMKQDRSVKILREIIKLEPVEFLGVCTILDVRPTDEEDKVRPFEDIWEDLCDKIENLNRVQKKNLDRLVRATIKGRKNNAY